MVLIFYLLKTTKIKTIIRILSRSPVIIQLLSPSINSIFFVVESDSEEDNSNNIDDDNQNKNEANENDQISNDDIDQDDSNKD